MARGGKKMRDDFDIEDVLKKYQSGPSSRVKKSVLTGFNHSFKGKGSHRDAVGFWKKPVPFYSVAVSLIVMVGMSFIAGQRTYRLYNQLEASHTISQEQDSTEVQDIPWTITQRDLL